MVNVSKNVEDSPECTDATVAALPSLTRVDAVVPQ
jgi:hypothetical protein